MLHYFGAFVGRESYTEGKEKRHFTTVFLIRVQTLFCSLSDFACTLHTKCMHFVLILQSNEGEAWCKKNVSHPGVCVQYRAGSLQSNSKFLLLPDENLAMKTSWKEYFTTSASTEVPHLQGKLSIISALSKHLQDISACRSDSSSNKIKCWKPSGACFRSRG